MVFNTPWQSLEDERHTLTHAYVMPKPVRKHTGYNVDLFSVGSVTNGRLGPSGFQGNGGVYSTVDAGEGDFCIRSLSSDPSWRGGIC